MLPTPCEAIEDERIVVDFLPWILRDTPDVKRDTKVTTAFCRRFDYKEFTSFDWSWTGDIPLGPEGDHPATILWWVYLPGGQDEEAPEQTSHQVDEG